MPKHKDFQKIYASMKATYGKRANSVYYAWVNKNKLDDTKSFKGWKYKNVYRPVIKKYRKITTAVYPPVEVNWKKAMPRRLFPPKFSNTRKYHSKHKSKLAFPFNILSGK